MKKLFIALLVALIGLAFTAPSFALEHEFGGYWRVRMYTQGDFDGKEADTPGVDDDNSLADTRTRLYYTAIINDNLKLVNKIEMDATWGKSGTYGDIGADEKSIEVKNTYADFNYNGVRAKVGTQGAVFHRGFLFDDDFSGVVLSFNNVTGAYAKLEEVDDNAGSDSTMYLLNAMFDLDTVKLTPSITYMDLANDDNLYFLGLDIDAALGMASLWGTFMFNGGEIGDKDVEGFLAAAGATVKMSDTFNIHGEIFYASGDDDPNDGDIEAFHPTGMASNGTLDLDKLGQSYYWSEIMGLGIFDFEKSNNSPGDDITNITAINLGVTVTPMEKLTCSLDLWYATLNEAAPGEEEELGFEVDFLATYQLIDGLKIDFVAAYLFADDGTTDNVANDEDPWEVGTRLSLSF